MIVNPVRNNWQKTEKPDTRKEAKFIKRISNGVDKIKALIGKYDSIKSKGLIKSYDEANTCKDFILPLFASLGWDISNREEVTAQASASGGRVDYAFCIKGIPKFFLEAKSLKADLNDIRWAEQTINYAWHKGVVWAVLTDFEAIKVFNAEWITKTPNESLFFEIRYDKYLENFDQLSLLSKQAFLENRLDKEAEKWGKKRRKIPVDEKLLSDILKWRNLLANSLRKNHPALLEEELDESIQRILDRLIFIRTCEDRTIEKPTLSPLLREWLDSGRKQRLSQKLKSVFRNFDTGYNSQIFTPHLCEDLKIDPAPISTSYKSLNQSIRVRQHLPENRCGVNVLEVIINGLYETEDRSIRYDFSAIDADVLGSMYEQYLGHILKKTPTRATVTEKHLRRKEMGIYYTPKYIVDYIVKNTVGEILKEKSYKDAMQLKILDPACGSGSFLIRAFEEMDNYLRDMRSQKGEEFAYFRRMEILNNNLYGVDLDKQAVEIAQLNLLLKALETRQKLPIIKNIKRGNSLISGDELTMFKYFGKDWKEKHPFNWQDEFQEAFKDGGFDVVIGNPPYLLLQNAPEQRNFFEFSSRFYNSAQYKIDTYHLFLEKGIRLLRDGGMLGFIVPNTFLKNKFTIQLRKFILENCCIKKIVVIPEKVFPEASVDTAIIILRKENNTKIRNRNIIDVFQLETSLTEIALKPQLKNVSQSAFTEKEGFAFNLSLDEKTGAWVDKMKNVSIPLGRFATAYFGIQTFDRNKYVSKKRLSSDYKPTIDGGDVFRYRLEPKGEYVQFLPQAIKSGGDSKVYTQPKIVVRQIGKAPIATFDDNKYHSLNTIYNIILINPVVNLKYVLAIINSSLIKAYWGIMFADYKATFPKIKKAPLLNIPIRKINFSIPKEKKMHDDLVKLVDKMLELNKQIQKTSEKSDKWYNLKSEIEKTDEKIDEVVFKLYGITEKEREIIERAIKE